MCDPRECPPGRSPPPPLLPCSPCPPPCQQFSPPSCSPPQRCKVQPYLVDVCQVAFRQSNSPYPMVKVCDAVNCILGHSKIIGVEMVPLREALHRTLAKEVCAADAVPPFAASTKDGYAVIAADGFGRRCVLSAAKAGCFNQCTVTSGQCMRVCTGSPLPPGADAVVQVEDTHLLRSSQDGFVEIEICVDVAPAVNQDIRPVGSDIRCNERIYCIGQHIGPSEMGLLAAIGVMEICCFKLPIVGVMSTGCELVEPGKSQSPGQIRDANRISLMFAIKEQGYPVIDLGICPESEEHVTQYFKAGLDRADVIVTSGGVSMGEKDLLKHVLHRNLGGCIHFARVFMKPGKPTTFATIPLACTVRGHPESSPNQGPGPVDPSPASSPRDSRCCSPPRAPKPPIPYPAGPIDKKLIFCLPGNPVSAIVTCHLFVLPALRKMAGHRKPLAPLVRARIARDIRLDPRPEFLRTMLIWDDPPEGSTGANTSREITPIAESTGSQISSRLCDQRAANGLLVLPERCTGQEVLKAGSLVNTMLLKYC